MNMKLNKVLSLVLIVGLAAPAFAGPVGVSRTPVTTQNTQVIADLASAKGEAEHLARVAFKGDAAARYRMKAVEIDNLIERLNSGEQVSPDEIDHAMQR
jgi:hypothetical protein